MCKKREMSIYIKFQKLWDVVRKYILCTGYIVAGAKDNKGEENREERTEGCRKNKSSHSSWAIQKKAKAVKS